MYPVMRGNYEKPPWEFCDRRVVFPLDCRTDSRWDDIARHYGPCLPCLDLLSGKHAARLKSWMNTAIHPKAGGGEKCDSHFFAFSAFFFAFSGQVP